MILTLQVNFLIESWELLSDIAVKERNDHRWGERTKLALIKF